MRRNPAGLAGALAALLAPTLLVAQAEEAVRRAVIAHYEAINAGNTALVIDQHVGAFTGFLFGQGTLERFGSRDEQRQAWMEDALEADFTPRDIEVVLLDEVALALFYLDGSFTGPDGRTASGSWGVTEVWVREGGEWKERHHHDSPLRPTAGEQQAAARAIDSVRQAESEGFSEGDIDGLLGLFTEDAVLMPPGEPPVSGRAEQRAWLERLYEAFEVDARYTDRELTMLDGVAFERVAFIMTLTPKETGEAISMSGKGLHIYRRQPDGSWKISLDIWNSDGPEHSESP